MLKEKILGKPIVWEMSRHVFELALSLYKKRILLMNKWHLLEDNPSVLDVGCGTGHYSHVTAGSYLGIDLNEEYINHALTKYKSNSKQFEVMNVTDLCERDEKFDLVMMVDILHHISDEQCRQLLSKAAKIAGRFIISFEPVTDQTNALGHWLIRSDRGKNMRSIEELNRLFEQADLEIVQESQLMHGKVYRTAAFLCGPPNKTDAKRREGIILRSTNSADGIGRLIACMEKKDQ